jgi:hypothetical protein
MLKQHDQQVSNFYIFSAVDGQRMPGIVEGSND